MTYNKKKYIIRTSKDNYYNFFLINGDLIVEEFSSRERIKSILKKEVLDYSLYIDEEERFYIIYINDKKTLNYTNYPDYNDDVSIFTINEPMDIKTLRTKIFNSYINVSMSFSDYYISIEWKEGNDIFNGIFEDVIYFKNEKNTINALLIEVNLKNQNIIELRDLNLKLEKEITNLKNKNLLNYQKYFQTINEYDNNIKELIKEHDNLLMNANLRIHSLFKIIEEKDSIISDLQIY